jgi:gas vesicle protein
MSTIWQTHIFAFIVIYIHSFALFIALAAPTPVTPQSPSLLRKRELSHSHHIHTRRDVQPCDNNVLLSGESGSVQRPSKTLAVRRPQAFGRRNFLSRIGNGIKNAANKVGSSVKRVAQKVGNAVHKVGSNIKHTAKKAANAVHKVGNGVKQAVKKLGNGVKHAVQKVGKGVKHAVKKFGNGVKHAVQKVGKGVKHAVKKFGNGVKHADSYNLPCA